MDDIQLRIGGEGEYFLHINYHKPEVQLYVEVDDKVSSKAVFTVEELRFIATHISNLCDTIEGGLKCD